jgi:DNA-binding NtrC family response regulator
MPDTNSAVLVVDDPDLPASIGPLLRSLGIDTQLFASIPDFLKSDRPDGSACLVLDVRLPGQSGLDLQRELAAANRELCYTWPREQRRLDGFRCDPFAPTGRGQISGSRLLGGVIK